MNVLVEISPRKVRVSPQGVTMFNWTWPCSELSNERAYWFEFDESGDLVDCDVPEHSEGPAAAAMSNDCKAWLFDGDKPGWIP